MQTEIGGDVADANEALPAETVIGVRRADGGEFVGVQLIPDALLLLDFLSGDEAGLKVHGENQAAADGGAFGAYFSGRRAGLRCTQ